MIMGYKSTKISGALYWEELLRQLTYSLSRNKVPRATIII